MIAIGFVCAAAALGAPDVDTLESLRALGYLDSVPTDNPEERGVTLLRSGVYYGMNLLSSRHKATAHLVDMQGEIHHTWRDSGAAQWMHAELQPNGDLLAITKDRFLTRLDSDSNVLWRAKLRAHHDFTVAPDGNILVLSRRVSHEEIEGFGRVPVLADTLVWVSPKGKILSEHRLFDLVKHWVSPEQIETLKVAVAKKVPWRRLVLPEFPGDLTHANSVEILDRAIPGIAPRGAVLLSIRELNRVVILDRALENVLWAWGEEELQGQHHATLLDDGTILLFDNGVRRERSRVLQIDPVEGRVVWSYSHPRLFTRLRGAAQRLPNGNVLITESDRGHALEVTPDKKIVWEFWNPEVRTDRGRTERDAIYRLLRYPPSAVASLE